MATETERKATADRAAGREAGAGARSQAPASRPEGGCPLNPLLSLSKSGALSLIARSFPSLRPATGRLPSIMLVQTSDGRAPRGVGEGRTGDLQLQRALPFQVFSPGTAALTLGFTPSPSRGPGALLLTTFSKSSHFWKKVDSLGPQLLVPPTCRVGGGCRFYLGQRPGLNAINTLIPYLQVLPRTCSPRGQGPCAYRERRRNPPKKTHRSLVGSTAVQFQNGRSAPLERSRPVNAEKNGRPGAATRASPAAPPPAFPAQPPTSEDAELARGVAARSPWAAAWTLAPDRAVKGWHVARRLKQRR